MKRRQVLKGAGLGLLALSGMDSLEVNEFTSKKVKNNSTWKINLFSKHLHWVGYDEMAKITSKIGFDGIDLTVRPGGHVEPANVEKELPLAVEACDKKGVEVPMMTTSIITADDPNTERILKTASSLGVKVYRLGWHNYNLGIPIEENIQKFGVELQKIAELNAKYNIIGDYQNHSGMTGGSPVWDIHMMLDIAQSEYLGAQYDIRHAMIEGLQSWPLGLRLLASKIHSIDIKDFVYEETDAGWGVKNVPLGEGAVDFKSYFKLLKELNVQAPISIHLEYPLGGADHGNKELTIPGDKVVEAMRKDLNYLKSVI
jgi:sugar phosphate isomerase/epimerase